MSFVYFLWKLLNIRAPDFLPQKCFQLEVCTRRESPSTVEARHRSDATRDAPVLRVFLRYRHYWNSKGLGFLFLHSVQTFCHFYTPLKRKGGGENCKTDIFTLFASSMRRLSSEWLFKNIETHAALLFTFRRGKLAEISGTWYFV